ncbi:MAG TPA: superoxide dismutase [Pirellulaceae bacterium]|nr:superoxide dismutase [Pirellulaceae bacterium]HMO92709.1 superoxide dismutase [Pirellulaceae bacterium]HMP70371.1 superoxide dismutase [Pirellulaceae bacterium]
MAHELPQLPYAFDALEPYIDAQTMEIHHGKHHATYVAKLNAAVEGTAFAGKSVDSLISDLAALPENIRTAVQNNAGGHANHTLFWTLMAPGGAGSLSGELASAINATFGNFDEFKKQFTDAALNRFGSGWAWLSFDHGKLKVESTANQDSPLMFGRIPLMGVDVWEHAYYLKYQNRRPDYVAAFFNVINWNEVARLFAAAQK